MDCPTNSKLNPKWHLSLIFSIRRWVFQEPILSSCPTIGWENGRRLIVCRMIPLYPLALLRKMGVLPLGFKPSTCTTEQAAARLPSRCATYSLRWDRLGLIVGNSEPITKKGPGAYS
jgi:hypothetical protein